MNTPDQPAAGPPLPLSEVLIKPSGADCNLACTYCYYRHRASPLAGRSPGRMSDGVLAALVMQATSGGAESVSFCWQGGEPTLMGLPFYEKATALQARHGAGVAVVNSLQTNGVLLDRDWAGFLRRHRFLVGLSIDGPRHVHDRCRVFADGRRSWATVVDRAKLLLDAGVPVNALTVVNDYAARFPEELYEFH